MITLLLLFSFVFRAWGGEHARARWETRIIHSQQHPAPGSMSQPDDARDGRRGLEGVRKTEANLPCDNRNRAKQSDDPATSTSSPDARSSDGRSSRLEGLAGGSSASANDKATALMPPPPPRAPRALPGGASLNPLLIGATVVSTSTSTTSMSLQQRPPPQKQQQQQQQQQQQPLPLAKRGRRGKIPLEKGYSQMEWLRRARERRGQFFRFL